MALIYQRRWHFPGSMEHEAASLARSLSVVAAPRTLSGLPALLRLNTPHLPTKSFFGCCLPDWSPQKLNFHVAGIKTRPFVRCGRNVVKMFSTNRAGNVRLDVAQIEIMSHSEIDPGVC